VTLDLDVLKCGNCEELKLGVHAGALAIAAVCGAYNAAAWLVRREPHLAINTVLYLMLIAWEQQHVSHHLETIRHPREANSLTAPSTPPASTLAA
jgi:hypothetical protein